MDEPIRVLMVNYKMQCAGIESFIMNMYRNIDRSKVQFDFLVHYTTPQFYDEEIEALGGKIYRLSVREDNNFVKYFRDLNAFFKEHKEYKIVHGHMESFGLFYLGAAKRAGVPVRIAHSHIAQRNKGIKGTLKSLLNRGFKTYATDLFACSDVAGEFLFGKGSQFTVYNNAVDTKKFNYDSVVRKAVREELGIDSVQHVIGHVGRFNTQKNHTFLLDVFAQLSRLNDNCILLLIGEGDLQEEIKKKVKVLELEDKVRFLGIRKDMHRLYQAMDVFLMPSLFEGLPVSGIEAQVTGLKCVFSDSVTQQTALTKNVEFLPLSQSAAQWAELINNQFWGYERKGQAEVIAAAGYDIKNQAQALQGFYLNQMRYS